MADETHLGVMFPSTEIGDDPTEIARFARTVESMGYDHVVTVDHVLGADPAVHGKLAGPYTNEHPFHEPFVLLGFLAGVCDMGLMTGILVLPQRQTVLAAKQAAEVDVLSGGRLRLGIGVGWNSVEYEALGMSFRDRGRRVEEQIDVMRTVWTGDTVSYEGREHRITDASVLPAPVQGGVPVWIGCGKSDVALARVGRIADGWMPNAMRPESLEACIVKVRRAAEGAGRDPDSIPIQGLVRDCRRDDLDQVRAELDRWRTIGASHIAFETSWTGLRSADEHLDVYEAIATLCGLA